MAIEIEYQDDSNSNGGKTRGSDNRLNTSSRSDSRGYYNSRDSGNSFSVPFDFQSAAADEFGAYWQNNHPLGLQLVIRSIGVNTVEAARIKLHFVTGTAAAGTAVTPTNLNKPSGNTSATSGVTTALEGASAATGITGLTSAGLIDFVYVAATGHEEFRLDDQVRLGTNDAIALEYDEGTGGDFSGVIFGYYEKKGKA